MRYLKQIAEDIRKYVPKESLPNEKSDLLFLIYAVLALAKRDKVTNEDVHNAWVAWMMTIDDNHESLVKYAELSDSTKKEDNIYLSAIKEAVKSISSTS